MEMKTKNIAFVVPCKNSKTTSHFIQNCVKSIIKNYPEQDIHIVDSNSTDKKTIREIAKKDKVYYHEIDNKNFSTGALWYIFDKFKNQYKNYFLIHDSTEIIDPVNNIDKINISPIMYSYDWLWPRLKTAEKQRSNSFAESMNQNVWKDFGAQSFVIWGTKMKLLKIPCLEKLMMILEEIEYCTMAYR